MLTLLLVSAIGLSLMIVNLAIFAEDLIKGQKQFRENFISRRKMDIQRIEKIKESNKDFLVTANKSFFAKRREKIESLIFKSDIKVTYYEYTLIQILFIVIGWLIGGFLHNVLISLVMAYIMSGLPKSYLKFVCGSLKRQISEQLEPALSQIIALLPSKKTLTNACESAIATMEEPLKTYFTEFINNINNANRSFEESLNELARKIDSRPFYDFARLAVVHYKHGGETMYAFNSIPEAMRDIKLIQSEQETELDSLKMLGFIFVFLAPASYLYYFFTDKDSFNILVNSGAGKTISFIVLVITLITIKLVINISKPVEV